MPQGHRIIITREALADLEKIAAYIRQQSPQNAAAVSEVVLGAIDSLAFLPARFKRVGKSRKRGSPIHAMVARPFIIYYRVEQSSETVYILNVFHGARRQPGRFE
ncbi:MAG TPA: type II toxin-antitoxin system RelE/ParE family toxin [Tepidisphaeraceae bacterium]|jgi:plasmid stabilization system protein ParE